jgi:hypothetical protein
MYLGKSITNSDELVSEASRKPPFGPGFETEDIMKADRMDIMHSSFEDVGPDFNEFILYCENQIIKKFRLPGF